MTREDNIHERLVARNAILINKLEERIEELEIAELNYVVDPLEKHYAMMKVLHDEIWNLMRNLKCSHEMLSWKS